MKKGYWSLPARLTPVGRGLWSLDTGLWFPASSIQQPVSSDKRPASSNQQPVSSIQPPASSNQLTMLETLITSKTRIKMLLKFFTNSASSAYLRGLAEEFDESTNSIRHELNNLSRAGYLVSQEDGRTILYRANTKHPLYNEVKNLVHKYLGIDKIIDHVLSRLGDLKLAFIVGDYAQGKDTGTIELILVGDINTEYLDRLTEKAKDLLHRTIRTEVISLEEFNTHKERFAKALLVWGNL